MVNSARPLSNFSGGRHPQLNRTPAGVDQKCPKGHKEATKAIEINCRS
jgi:hypothetical protein